MGVYVTIQNESDEVLEEGKLAGFSKIYESDATLIYSDFDHEMYKYVIEKKSIR